MCVCVKKGGEGKKAADRNKTKQKFCLKLLPAFVLLWLQLLVARFLVDISQSTTTTTTTTTINHRKMENEMSLVIGP